MLLFRVCVFQGETIGEILAEILKADPDWTRLPAATPPGIRRLLRRCLQKDQALRLRDIGDARIEIHELQSGIHTEAQVGPAVPSRKERLAWMAALALVTLVAAAIMVWIRHGSPYMVSRDGQRFLMNTITEEAGTSPIIVILNWKPKP